MQLQFLYLSPTIDHFSFLVNMALMYRSWLVFRPLFVLYLQPPGFFYSQI